MIPEVRNSYIFGVSLGKRNRESDLKSRFAVTEIFERGDNDGVEFVKMRSLRINVTIDGSSVVYAGHLGSR